MMRIESHQKMSANKKLIPQTKNSTFPHTNALFLAIMSVIFIMCIYVNDVFFFSTFQCSTWHIYDNIIVSLQLSYVVIGRTSQLVNHKKENVPKEQRMNE